MPSITYEHQFEYAYDPDGERYPRLSCQSRRRVIRSLQLMSMPILIVVPEGPFSAVESESL